jgi:uncharacterized protein (TIGR02757 family)
METEKFSHTGMTKNDLKRFLDEKYLEYNQPFFIENDPISIPHQFEKKEDIEIAGFFTSTIAWGNRASIIKNSERLIKEMGYYPYEFIMNSSEKDFLAFRNFVHRTFNGIDTVFFLQSFQHIYKERGGLEPVFSEGYQNEGTLTGAIQYFRKIFFEIPHEQRTEKHIADLSKNASGKRLCMFLRWMVRNDNRGVDFGIWKDIPTSALMLPLDLHTGNVSRILGLLHRNQNDWKAVEEVTARLREFDPEDPVKYDFSLFGLGINKAI